MNVCIIYYSKFGNGKKCVEYVEKSLREKGHSVRVFFITEIKPDSLPEADLYIFSSPTHMGRPAGKLKRFLKKLKLKSEGAGYALINTCSTRGDENSTALEKMSNILESKGMKETSKGVKIKVLGMKGPLEEDYMKKLDPFIDGCIGKS